MLMLPGKCPAPNSPAEPGVNHRGAVLDRTSEFVFAQFLKRREGAKRRGAIQIQANVVGKIGRTIGQVGRHLPNELMTIGDLQRPVQLAFLADERERRIRNGPSAKRACAMRGINLHFIR